MNNVKLKLSVLVTVLEMILKTIDITKFKKYRSQKVWRKEWRKINRTSDSSCQVSTKNKTRTSQNFIYKLFYKISKQLKKIWMKVQFTRFMAPRCMIPSEISIMLFFVLSNLLDEKKKVFYKEKFAGCVIKG